MRLRIGDIGLGPRHRLFEAGAVAGSGNRHRGVELPESDRGEFADEAGQVAEMMGGGGVRHPGLARHRAQRQPRQAVAFEHPFGRLEQGVVQGAVMVRRLHRRPAPPRRSMLWKPVSWLPVLLLPCAPLQDGSRR